MASLRPFSPSHPTDSEVRRMLFHHDHGTFCPNLITIGSQEVGRGVLLYLSGGEPDTASIHPILGASPVPLIHLGEPAVRYSQSVTV